MSAPTTVFTVELDLLTRRALQSRYWGAIHALEDSQRAFEVDPNDVTAAQIRWAEAAREDAIALAGEFQVPDLPWSLS